MEKREGDGQIGKTGTSPTPFELQLHLIESLTDVSGLNGLDDCVALAAYDVREITALKRQRESAALWIAKI